MLYAFFYTLLDQILWLCIVESFLHMQPAKLYKLKHLSKVEVVTNDPSGCTFTLVMLHLLFTFENRKRLYGPSFSITHCWMFEIRRTFIKCEVICFSLQVKYFSCSSYMRLVSASSWLSVLQGFDNLRSQSVAPPQWTMRNIDDR